MKLQQVTGLAPDVTVFVGVSKELAVQPKDWTQTVGVTMPIPIWDQNRGGILSAEAALIRATEEPHRVELNLTNGLANAYNNYTNNLAALEYYRRYILPDLVRTYQAIYQRRGIDQGVVFSDIVQAQQTLVTNVGTYLTILGQLWTSVTGVADYLQTDNLFQVGQPMALPALPDFEHIPGWPCCHPCAAPGTAGGVPCTNGAAVPGTAAAPTVKNASSSWTTSAVRPAPPVRMTLDVVTTDAAPSGQ